MFLFSQCTIVHANENNKPFQTQRTTMPSETRKHSGPRQSRCLDLNQDRSGKNWRSYSPLLYNERL